MPPNPFGPKNLSHSAAMSVHFHSNKWVNTLRPSIVSGSFVLPLDIVDEVVVTAAVVAVLAAVVAIVTVTVFMIGVVVADVVVSIEPSEPL